MSKALFVSLLTILSTLAKADLIEIRAIDGLRYDVTRRNVAVGKSHTLLFQNADGTDQPHNIVIGKPNSLKDLLATAMAPAQEAVANDFVPLKPDLILAASKLLKAGERQELALIFAEPGIYPFICTFPGHGQLMYGAFYAGVTMPPLDQDPNIPKPSLEQKTFAPFPRPTVQRIFMPEASPAAIAIALPGKWNACWDAGPCRLRYLWRGDFIDAEKHFTSKGTGTAELKGPVVWRDTSGFPLILEGLRQQPQPKFKGYSLHQGLPTFHYTLGSLECAESLSTTASGGFIRAFTFNHLTSPLTLRLPTDPKVKITASVGQLNDGLLKLSSEEAREFRIEIETVDPEE